MKEYRLLLEGYDKRQRVFWEVARWEQFQQMMMNPNIKPFNKPRTLHQFHSFPWDEQPNNIKAEDIKITENEVAVFNALMADFKERNKSIS